MMSFVFTYGIIRASFKVYCGDFVDGQWWSDYAKHVSFGLIFKILTS